MFEEFVEEAICSIESVKQYYYTVMPSICEAADKLFSENFLGYLIDEYPKFAMMPEDSDEARDVKNRFLKLVERFVLIENVKTDDTSFSFNYEFIDAELSKKYLYPSDIKEMSSLYKSGREMQHIHHDNMLIMLIIRFEQFIASIYMSLMRMYPEKYISVKEMKYADIIRIGADHIEEYLIIREVESLMRDKLSVWFTKLSEHKIKVEVSDETMDDLKEAYYRRNIIVHNNAVVNDAYLAGVSDTRHKDVKRDSNLHATEKYINNIITTVETVVYAVGMGLLKIESEKTGTLNRYFEMAYRHLRREEWNICKYVFGLIKSRPEVNSDIRTMSLVNYWISCINICGLESIRSEIENQDFTALQEKFLLAQKVLLQKYADATDILKRIFPEIITATNLETWPLFKQYRETGEYSEFKKANIEKFDIHTYDTSIINDVADGGYIEIVDCEHDIDNADSA